MCLAGALRRPTRVQRSAEHKPMERGNAPIANTVQPAKTCRIIVWISASVRTSTAVTTAHLRRDTPVTHQQGLGACGAGRTASSALVHHQNGRVAEHGAREAEELPLPNRQQIAAVADFGVQSLRHSLDRGLELRLLQRVPQLLVRVLRERTAIVIRWGLAGRTANKSRKHHHFTRGSRE